jgi:3-oxoacyl-[acyl-carrier protein] reductase
MTSAALFTSELAVVTGSASNIGRAIARALAREGATVVLADVNAEGNAVTARDIAAAGGDASGLHATADFIAAAGGTCEAVTVDLAGRDGWRAIVDHLGTRTPHMLVHAACPPRREADHALAVSEDTFDAMVNTNVRSGFLLARAVAERMIAAGTRGRLAFITSLHAESPRNLPHYSASKAAQTMLVKELARAFGRHGIRVNAIAPGAIPGGGFNAAAYDFSDKIPLGRLGHADDIAAMTMAVLSDRFAGYVTGATIAVDGGLDLYNWIMPAKV